MGMAPCDAFLEPQDRKHGWRKRIAECGIPEPALLETHITGGRLRMRKMDDGRWANVAWKSVIVGQSAASLRTSCSAENSRSG